MFFLVVFFSSCQYYFYQKDELTSPIVSVDPNIDDSVKIAHKLFQANYSVSLFIQNTTYIISHCLLNLVGYKEVPISKNPFNKLLDNDNYHFVWKYWDVCVIHIMIGIFFLIFGEWMIRKWWKQYIVPMPNSWRMKSDGTVLSGDDFENLDRVSKASILDAIKESIEFKELYLVGSKLIRKSQIQNFELACAFEFTDGSFFGILCDEYMTTSAYMDVDCRLEVNGKETDIETVVEFTSFRNFRPVSVHFKTHDNEKCCVHLPSAALAPFIPFGNFISVIVSMFFETLSLLEAKTFSNINFPSLVESYCTKLGIKQAYFFAKGDGLYHAYSRNGQQIQDQDFIQGLVHRYNFRRNVYRSFFNEGDFCYCDQVSSSSLTVYSLFVLDNLPESDIMANMVLPFVRDCCVFLYQLSNTKEQNLKFERFMNLISTSNVFSLFEFSMTNRRLMIIKSSVYESIESLITIDDLISKINSQFVGGITGILDEFKRLDSEHPVLKQRIFQIESDKTMWLSLSAVISHDEFSREDICTILVEEITALKLQESELRDSMADLQLAMKALGLIKFVINKGVIEMENDTLFKALGYDCNLKYLKKVVHEKDLSKIEKLSNGEKVTLRLTPYNSRAIWYSGFSNGTVGFVFCVNELIEMRQRLQTAGKGLQLASSALSLVFWSVDLEHDLVMPLIRPPTIWDFFSVDQHTKFSRFSEFIHIEDRHLFIEHFKLIQNRRISQWTGDIRLLLIEGRYEWHRIIMAMSNSDTLHCLIVNTNKQKESEKKLWEANKIRELLFSSGKLTIWKFFDNYESLLSIQKFAPGINNAVIMNWNYVDNYLDHDIATRFREKMTQAISNNECFEMRIPFFKDDSMYVSLRGKYQPMSNQIVGVCIDITELENAYVALEIQRQRAVEADRQKTVFLANMSHEIRTPMNGIFGVLDLIASSELTPEQRILVDSIRTSSFQLMKLLDDTLNLSRIEQGDIESNPGIFDFWELVEPICIATASRGRQSSLNFSVNVGSSFPSLVYGDSQLIGQIFNNLLSNSLKFTRKGGITVGFTWDCSYDMELCEIKVIDTGIGISPDQQKIIFERFVQADPSVMRSYGGTGLGLALVQEIVRFLGGELYLNSEVGKGSEFTVVIPLTSVKFDYFPMFTDKKRHIILISTIDDSIESFLDICVSNLRYEVFHFNDFDQMVDHLNSGFVDVVFIEGQLDLCKTVYEYVKQMPKAPHLCSITDPEEVSILNYKISKPLLPHKIRKFLHSCRFGHLIESQVLPIKNDQSSNSKKVLVVEDNKANQFVMKKILQNIGCQFHIVDNGLLAINALDQDNYDLVFMDCQMPVLDGIQATKRIRESEKSYKDIKIVALTASAVEGDEETCLQVGMNAYLAKPVRLQQIRDIIKVFCS